MNTLRGAIIVSLLILLISWLSGRAINPDAERFDRVLGELDRFSMIDAALHRDVLAARAGILHNYDPMVRETNRLNASLDNLRRLTPGSALSARAIDQLAHAVENQEDLVEAFKTDNALVQNSLAYFAMFSDQFSQSHVRTPLAGDVSALAVSMLRFALDTTKPAADELDARLADLERLHLATTDAEDMRGLLAHARLLYSLLPKLDHILKVFSAISEKQERDIFRDIVVKQQMSSRETARVFRLLLSITSLLLIAILIHLALRSHAWAVSLRRKAALEHVLTEISLRFINCAPQVLDSQIERALAEIGDCVGADRAYYAVSGPQPQLHCWQRPSLNNMSRWPAEAMAFARNICLRSERVMLVRDTARHSRAEENLVLSGFGIRGWACAMTKTVDGFEAILGFDTVGSPCRINCPGELNLLPIALDMIVSASRRKMMEIERERLESSLQQARRLETVGALASGIAHNFNNIVGAILGYAEIAEAKFGSHAGMARALSEIRGAGERARDLVGQILAFGRRHECRRRATRVRAVISETTSLLTASLPSSISVVILDSPHDPVVCVDPTAFQQVIFNLCINAAQAMGGIGRIEVEIDIDEFHTPRALSHGELPAGVYCCIGVRDFGRGMDKATVGRIFEPFFTTRNDGHGLGLATAREVIEDSAGTINVDSSPGVGSRFEIWLPCETTQALEAIEDVQALPLGRGETVLVIDDHPEERLRAEEILAALGYEPVGFTNPQDALATCCKTPARFDAFIIGHLGLTKASIEFAVELHKLVPDHAILLAAVRVRDVSAPSLALAGIGEVVSRPLVASEIATALRRSLASLHIRQ